MNKITIIFICLGNYCRSPMAEAIFKYLALEDGNLDCFDISSAGTRNWDVGSRPYIRVREILAENNIPLDPEKRARQITPIEIKTADYLIAMSSRIMNELGNPINAHRLLDYASDSEIKDIPDPYPSNTFQESFDRILKGTKAFYAEISKRLIGLCDQG